MNASTGSFRGVGLLSVCSLIQLGLQLWFQMWLASWFGTSLEMDAYTAALTLPAVAGGIISSTLGFVLIPVFLSHRHNAGEEAGWLLAGKVVVWLFVFLGIVVFVVFLEAEQFVAFLQPGFVGDKLETTVRLLRVLSLLFLIQGLSNFSQAIHHALGYFALPALSPPAGTILTMGFVWWKQHDLGIDAVAWGAVLGGLLSAVLQLSPLLLRLRWGVRLDESLKKMAWLMLPLFLGAYNQFWPLIDTRLASEFPEGSIAGLGYSWRFVSAILLLSTSSLSMVVFPALSRFSAGGLKEEFRFHLARSLRFLVFMVMPLFVGMVGFSEPVVRNLLEGGSFLPKDTQTVSLLMTLYLGVLVGGSLGEILGKSFFSLQETKVPMLLSIVGFSLGTALKFYWAPRYGAFGLVSATSIHFLMNASLMGWVLTRRLGPEMFAGIYGTLGRAGASSFLGAGAAWGVLRLDMAGDLVWAVLAGAIVYFSLMTFFQDEFAMLGWSRAKRILFGKSS